MLAINLLLIHNNIIIIRAVKFTIFRSTVQCTCVGTFTNPRLGRNNYNYENYVALLAYTVHTTYSMYSWSTV